VALKDRVSKLRRELGRLALVAVTIAGLEWLVLRDVTICSATPPNVCSFGVRVKFFVGHGVFVFLMGAMARRIFGPGERPGELRLH
jgi:hypothetical protein